MNLIPSNTVLNHQVAGVISVNIIRYGTTFCFNMKLYFYFYFNLNHSLVVLSTNCSTTTLTTILLNIDFVELKTVF